MKPQYIQTAGVRHDHAKPASPGISRDAGPGRISESRFAGAACAALPAFLFLLAAGIATAQTTIDVGGAGTIGDTTLITSGGTAKLPGNGDVWSAAGGEGNVYSGLVSPTVAVPTTGAVTLAFTHRYNFEADYDGGAVFISVNGAPAVYLDGTAFTSNGYNKAVVGNVWTGGENVFNGQSSGFGTPAMITSVADLSSLNLQAGDTISVEFRGGWDDAFIQDPAPNWEISTVKLTDSTATDFLNADFNADGTSNFTVSNTGTVSGPWDYSTPVFNFELNADTTTADRYKPDVAGSTIDLNNAKIVVDLLTGTLTNGQVFSLFDLSGGTTLTGSIASITLVPPGIWDTSNLATNGTITFVSPPPSLTWNAATGTGTWDTITENWIGDSTTFTDDGSNIVTFNDTPAVGGTVTVTQGMSPYAITVDTTGTLKLITGVSGTGVANSIDSGILTKNGTGTLQLGDDDLNQQFGGSPNVYSNGFTAVTLNAGTVKFNSCKAFGTGLVTVAGGVSLIQARVEGRYGSSNENVPNDFYLSGGLVNTPLAFGTENKGIWFSGVVSGPGGFNVTGDSRYLGFSNDNTFSGGITVTSTVSGNGPQIDFGKYDSLGTGALNISENKLGNTTPRGGLCSRANLPGDTSFPNGVPNAIIIASGKYAHLKTNSNSDTLLWGGVISGGGILRKYKSSGTIILGADNTYTGGTVVDAGKLLINGDSSAATGDVQVGNDATSIASTLGGTGTIGGNIHVGALGTIAPGDNANPLGTFTAAGDAAWDVAGGSLSIEINDAAAPKNDTLAVSGVLDISNATLNLVVTGTPAENAYVIATYGSLTGTFAAVNNLPPGYVVDYHYNGGNAIAISLSSLSLYELWASGYSGLGDSDPSLDFDKGGLPTGIEWVVGGDPSDGGDDHTVAPFADTATDPNYLIFTYRRTNQAKLDSNTSISVEYGSDLAGWTTAANNGIDIFIDEYPGFYGTGIDKIEVAIDRSLATDGKLFARLKVAVSP